MTNIQWRFAPSLVEDALAQLLPQSSEEETLEGHARLRQAMRYAVFSGGKRLRSQLVLEAAGVMSANLDVLKVLPAACALEIIHAYSLVHDDLPSMDNADTRRGRPSCHKAFDEATAILVGDGLLTLAFDVVTGEGLTPSSNRELADHAQLEEGVSPAVDALLRLHALRLIARAAGEAGMVGGQAVDITWSHGQAAQVTGTQLLQMHAMKTGALIRCACEVGALLGGATPEELRAFAQYGEHLGRAFQIQDDVLDVEGDPQLTGKSATDTANYKLTAPAFFGLAEAKELAREASAAAIDALQPFGDRAAALRQLACFVTQREK